MLKRRNFFLELAKLQQLLVHVDNLDERQIFFHHLQTLLWNLHLDQLKHDQLEFSPEILTWSHYICTRVVLFY